MAIVRNQQLLPSESTMTTTTDATDTNAAKRAHDDTEECLNRTDNSEANGTRAAWPWSVSNTSYDWMDVHVATVPFD